MLAYRGRVLDDAFSSYDRLFDTIEAGIVLHRADTSIAYANPAALRILRLTEDQALGKKAMDPAWNFVAINGEPLSLGQYPINRVIAEDGPIENQVLGVVDSSTQLATWVRASAFPERRKDGSIAHIAISFVDITTSIVSQRLRGAQRDITAFAQTHSEHEILQRFLYWCEEVTDSSISFLHFVHEDQEEIELVAWSQRTEEEHCHVEGLESHYPLSQAGIWAEAYHQKKPVVYNSYEQAPDKKGLPVGHAELGRLVTLPVIEDGTIRILMGVGNKPADYTDEDVLLLQILMEQVWHIVGFRRAEQRSLALAQVVEQSASAIILTDGEGYIRYTNHAFTAMTGFDFADVEGTKPGELDDGTYASDAHRDLWYAVSEGRVWRGRMVHKKKTGEKFWSSVVVSPLRDASGAADGYMAIAEDITEQVEAERQL